MPSYCCSSMLSVFKKYNIEMYFYDVNINESGLYYNIDENADIDLFFAMSYFGLENSLDSIIKKMTKKNIIVLEDITHRLLSNTAYSENSHYLIASLRKWFPIPTGGLLMNKYGHINNKPYKNSDGLVRDQITAMKLKSQYLQGKESINKDIFLSKFQKLNNFIKDIDYKYKIDNFSKKVLYSLDINNIKEQRKINAQVIYEHLSKFKLIEPLFKNVDLNKMTPLFVPIIMKKSEDRAKLIKNLIENKIYCPVHWPIPEEINLNDQNKEVYEREISLICDQRYSMKEIDKIIKTIGEFEKKHA